MRIRPWVGRLKAITRPMSVLLPDPLEPTSAVVLPAGASNEIPFSTGWPGLYSNHTLSKATVPTSGPTSARCASSCTSVDISSISRMRSRPANASVICVPIEAMPTSGAATMPMKKM